MAFSNKMLRPRNPLNREAQIPRYKLKFHQQIEFVPRDSEESEPLDVVDFGGAEFSVETVIVAHISLQNEEHEFAEEIT